MSKWNIENQQPVRDALRVACQRFGSQKKFAACHKISQTVLSDMIIGRRDVSARIAAMVGFERVVVFRPTSEPVVVARGET